MDFCKIHDVSLYTSPIYTTGSLFSSLKLPGNERFASSRYSKHILFFANSKWSSSYNMWKLVTKPKFSKIRICFFRKSWNPVKNQSKILKSIKQFRKKLKFSQNLCDFIRVVNLVRWTWFLVRLCVINKNVTQNIFFNEKINFSTFFSKICEGGFTRFTTKSGPPESEHFL